MDMMNKMNQKNQMSRLGFLKRILCMIGLGFLFKKTSHSTFVAEEFKDGSLAFSIEEYEEDDRGLIITKARPMSISLIDPRGKPHPVSSLSEISFTDPNA